MRSFLSKKETYDENKSWDLIGDLFEIDLLPGDFTLEFCLSTFNVNPLLKNLNDKWYGSY